MASPPKVALVHDWLVSRGGAERVLRCFHEIFPEAPIYTLVYNPDEAPDWVRDCDVRTTYIQKWPGAKSHHKLLLSFMPKAWEALDLTEYDLVLSSCASCCKGVLTRPDAVHVCFCHSPIRYVWDLYYDYLEGAGWLKRILMPHLIHGVRMWDYLAAQRVDIFVANSDYVAARIRKFYHRDALTIHPGIALEGRIVSEERDDYYLVVSRFVRYKRIDLAIEACNSLGRRLLVVGSGGEEEAKLRAMAGPTVEFLGRVNDDELNRLFGNARALLFPGIEDFGLTPVEAMAGGCPVLAYAEGGTLETVMEGKTGLFFHEQTVGALVGCIKKFEEVQDRFVPTEIARRATGFSERAFADRLMRVCWKAVDDFRGDISEW